MKMVDSLKTFLQRQGRGWAVVDAIRAGKPARFTWCLITTFSTEAAAFDWIVKNPPEDAEAVRFCTGFKKPRAKAAKK
jgi:hypothetical protein